MYIKGLQKTSLVDYPGKICATIFLGGCNMRCGYCHNRDLVLNPSRLPTISQETILAFLQKRKNVLDAVCISGGEPTIYPNLPKFIRQVKEIGYTVKLDTNGTNPIMVEKLLNQNLVDYIAMDIKAPLQEYSKITNTQVDKDAIKKTTEIIKLRCPDYEFRMTVLPHVTTKKSIQLVGQWLNGTKRFYLQQFRPVKTMVDPSLSKHTPHNRETLAEFKEILQKTIAQVEIRNT